MSEVAITFDRLRIKSERALSAHLLENRLQVSAAFCSHYDLVMRLARPLVLLTLGLVLACRSPATPQARDCGGPLTPSEPPRSAIRQGRTLDTAYARQGLARLVFRVRSAGPTAPGSAIAAPTVLLRDSLADYRTQLARIGDSNGFTILDSVALHYRTARVQRLGYVGLSFPLVVRSGYSDTIDVALAEARICLYH